MATETLLDQARRYTLKRSTFTGMYDVFLDDARIGRVEKIRTWHKGTKCTRWQCLRTNMDRIAATHPQSSAGAYATDRRSAAMALAIWHLSGGAL